jgi:predicted extracellular nuclease
MKLKSTSLAVMAFSALAAVSSQGAVLITQYYEGPSTNKWIEITNTGTTSVDLATLNYKLGLYTNASAEGYKTGLAPSQTLSLNGSLASGASFLYGNTGNTTPSYATATVSSNSVINFNGNDSIVLWTGTTFTTSSIVDAIGFTNSGNEGVDKSFVRLNADQGWNTTTGSNVLDFSTVWSQIALATVNDATAGTEARLGFSAIPEPSAALLGGIGLLALLRRRR